MLSAEFGVGLVGAAQASQSGAAGAELLRQPLGIFGAGAGQGRDPAGLEGFAREGDPARMRRQRADGGEEYAMTRRRRAQPLERRRQPHRRQRALGGDRRGRIGQHGDGVRVEMGMRADPRQGRLGARDVARQRGARLGDRVLHKAALQRLFKPAGGFVALEQAPRLLAKPLGQRLETAGAGGGIG